MDGVGQKSESCKWWMRLEIKERLVTLAGGSGRKAAQTSGTASCSSPYPGLELTGQEGRQGALGQGCCPRHRLHQERGVQGTVGALQRWAPGEDTTGLTSAAPPPWEFPRRASTSVSPSLPGRFLFLSPVPITSPSPWELGLRSETQPLTQRKNPELILRPAI